VPAGNLLLSNLDSGVNHKFLLLKKWREDIKPLTFLLNPAYIYWVVLDINLINSTNMLNEYFLAGEIAYNRSGTYQVQWAVIEVIINRF
jgi:hypothetical protein